MMLSEVAYYSEVLPLPLLPDLVVFFNIKIWREFSRLNRERRRTAAQWKLLSKLVS